jgi:non-specific serine/threonine protein kinase/serine/threonine-protein kinase
MTVSDSELDSNNNPRRKPDSDSENKTRTHRTDVGADKLSAHQPKQIGQYVIKRVIASGGMGTVFEAVQENPRRPVAVKVVKGSLATEEAVRRFEYEAQTLARLRHPGIAQVYEAGSYDEGGSPTPFFAMEYIPNAKAVTEYAADKRLSTRDRLELFLQVCDAVHHGHQRGIVHRDLKPSNILVDSNGRVRVIDFGVARATDADMKQAAVQTEVGQFVGSVQYMSPEQFDADPHDIDTRSDVYALGLILYELLSGTLPYATDSDKIFDFASEVREGKTTPLGLQDRSLRGELEAVVHKAMQRDRERRYQSAYGLDQDIRRYLTGEAVVARHPGLSYQLRVFARTHKAIIGLVSGAFALLLAGVIITTSLLLKVDQERQKAEIASQRASAGQEFLSRVLTSAFPPGWGDKTTVLGVLDRASQMLTGAFPHEPEIEAELRRSLGNAYLNIGHREQAKRELVTALALSKNTLGESHDKTLELLDDLWLVYLILDDNKELLETTRARESAVTERYGASHLEVLYAKGGVAHALRQNGAVSAARRVSEEVWLGLKRQLGVDSAGTLYEQTHYAWLLLESGRVEEAAQLARDALNRAHRVYGEQHQRARAAKSSLAAAYIVQGKIDSAKTLYGNRQAPEKFGIEHVFQGSFDLGSKPFQLLVFFETWCPFSRPAMVRLEQVHRQYDQFGLNVSGLTRVGKNTTENEVERYLDDQSISFAAFKENGRSWNYFDCNGTPSIRLLCNGYLIWEHVYPATDEIPTQMLEAMVEAQNCGIIP